MRLIHNDQRAVPRQQVAEGEFDPPLGAALAGLDPLHPRGIGGHGGEMRFEILVMGINAAAIGIGDTQGLHGGHHDAGAALQIGRGDLREIGNIEYPETAAEGIVQGFIIRVARGPQRFHGLAADGVGRHQEQRQREFPVQIGCCRDRHGMGGQQRLAAAGRQPQADTGHGRQAGERPIGARRPHPRLVHAIEGRLRPAPPRRVQIGAQPIQRFGLIFFEDEGRHRAFRS